MYVHLKKHHILLNVSSHLFNSVKKIIIIENEFPR